MIKALKYEIAKSSEIIKKEAVETHPNINNNVHVSSRV